MIRRRQRNVLRKRVVNRVFVQWLLSHLVALLMRFVYLTSRIERQPTEAALPYMHGEKPAIFCFWHGRMIMQCFIKPPHHKMVVMISQHNDGALITAIMRRFRIGAARGSSKRGGREAVRAMLDIASRGDNLCFTPDGPRGPNQVAAPGAAFTAMKTGYMLVPVSFSATRHWRNHSWDRFMIPKPFGRIHYRIGDPITVAPDSDAEALAAASAHLTAALNHLTAEADAACGVAA